MRMGPGRLLTLGLSPAPVFLSAVEQLDVLSLRLSGTRVDKLAERLLVDWGAEPWTSREGRYQECRAGFPYASGQPVDGLERFVAHRLLSQGV